MKIFFLIHIFFIVAYEGDWGSICRVEEGWGRGVAWGVGEVYGRWGILGAMGVLYWGMIR